ncbi:hydroxyethylthiazole kinase [Bounagaea algeriensis]
MTSRGGDDVRGRSALPGVDAAARALERLRARVPLVHALTNAPSAGLLPNVLLAAGATTVLVDNPHEAGVAAEGADAVLINLGTPTEDRVAAFPEAVRSARASARPWVLDPVGVGGLPWRTRTATELVQLGPAAVRANPSEINALAGSGARGRGVDSSEDSAAAEPAMRALLAEAGAVSASGPVDRVLGSTPSGGIGMLRVRGGSELLARVSATGCALGALCAAYLAAEPDRLTAVVAAHVHYAVAAELAEGSCRGPGTFAPAFLDALAFVGSEQIRAHGRVEPAWHAEAGGA